MQLSVKCLSRGFRSISLLQSVKNAAIACSVRQNRNSGAARLVAAAPKSVQPYLRLMRVDKPIGIWLLYWPCAWSIALAAPAGSLPNFTMLGLFGTGAFLMRSAGCVVNDIFDKNLDKKVKRTQARPLASGELSEKDAVCLLALLLSASFGILMQLNWLSIEVFSVMIGASSLSLVFAYPFAKRYTYWPQFVLGMAFNWGTILGWTAVQDDFSAFVVLALYSASINWTLLYDTIYAHQDRTDDLIAGIKSTALLFGNRTKHWLTGFACATVLGFGASGAMLQQTWPFYCGLVATGAHLAWQIGTVDVDNPEDCHRKFRSNQWLGVLLFSGIVAGNLLRCKNVDDESLT